MKIIGHRGAKGLAPENTLASIDKAIQHGVHEIEVDVQLTKDGVAILHHDPYFIQPSGAKSKIAATTYAELLQYRPNLATLDMTIQHIAHRVPLIIELKTGVSPNKVFTIIRLYERRGWRLDEFAIASFDMSILEWFRTHEPQLPLIINERWSGIRATYWAHRLGVYRISMNQRWLWLGFLRMMQRRGYAISPYTVNSVRQAIYWSPYVYGIFTDYPDQFEVKGQKPRRNRTKQVAPPQKPSKRTRK